MKISLNHMESFPRHQFAAVEILCELCSVHSLDVEILASKILAHLAQLTISGIKMSKRRLMTIF